MNSLANLYAVFRTLPPEIREWLTSDEVGTLIGAIAERFVLSQTQERGLPILLLRLATQDVPPESFKAAVLERLAVSPDIARDITAAILADILSPIAQALRFSGIETDAIGLDAPIPATDAVKSEARISKSETAAPKPITPGSDSVTLPSPTPMPAPQGPATIPAQPFILHVEPKAARPEAPKSSFSFTPSPMPAGSGGRGAPKVMIERVVHYGALTTPLTSPCGLRRASSQHGQPPLKTPPASKWFSS